DTSGLGLGLSIVKTLVEKHSGIVRAESAGVGQGSTFTVILPLTETKITADEKKPIPQDERPLNGVNVLIVEDDTDSGEVLELFLTQSGARAAFADSAKKAMKVLENKRGESPDIIISDLAMPDEDGYSLINRIRRLPSQKGGQIPAIALSAFASNDNKKKAFEAGFQKYHTKPFEPDLLIKEILELVNK
ncbi:MAG TPA: hybrid sensor histidine kinase/response regulator, partial [Pyrinomonadaceae bacterium]|nr:hybrid sensor histidine kinase/response regulator [Pyrinomonadaceae bacterium]